jgi:hypothetical protein
LAILPVEALFVFLLLVAAFFFFAAGAAAVVRLRVDGRVEEVLAAWRAKWRVVPMSEEGIVKKDF